MSKTTSLGQIENKSLRDQVLDSIRSAVVNGELKPGDTLVETELATQLGVSRAPLREAINVLNMEGLLETVPYHGTKVKKLVRKDIEELYSVRSMMEALLERLIQFRYFWQAQPLELIIAACRGRRHKDFEADSPLVDHVLNLITVQ